MNLNHINIRHILVIRQVGGGISQFSGCCHRIAHAIYALAFDCLNCLVQFSEDFRLFQIITLIKKNDLLCFKMLPG